MRRPIVVSAALLGVALLAVAASGASGNVAARCRLKWRAVPTPRINGNGLVDVAALTRSDVWAVGGPRSGRVGRVLVGHWNGRRWSKTRLATRGTVNAISGTSSNDLWAVGSTPNLKPLILHYDGRRWATVAALRRSEYIEDLYDVVALARDDAWAVGSTFVRETGHESALIMHWDGHAWVDVAAPPGARRLAGIDAVSPHDAWAVGPVQDQTFEAVVMHWDGTVWDHVDTAIGAVDLGHVTAASANDVWAVGSTYGLASRGVVAHWNGRVFRVVRTTGPNGTDILSDVTVSGRDVWAVGLGQAEHWTGRRWRSVRLPATFWSADALSSRNIWAAGAGRRGNDVYRYACG